MKGSNRNIVWVGCASMALFGLAALYVAIQQARDTARTAECANTMRLLLGALRDYDQTFGHLPAHVQREASGLPLSSWRLELQWFASPLPFRPSRTDPWNSPKNQFHLQRSERLYCKNGETSTSVFALVGPGTAFDSERPRSLKNIDGDTILLLEIRNSETHWMAPGDFDVRTLSNSINDPSGKGISSSHRQGFHVGFADGEVWLLSHHLPFAELQKFFTLVDARQHNRDDVLARWRVHSDQ